MGVKAMSRSLSDYYRMPVSTLGCVEADKLVGNSGFFRFGPNTVCYGHSSTGVAGDLRDSELFDASKSVRIEGSTVRLPFDIDEVIENLRREHYEGNLVPGVEKISNNEWIRKTYYSVRELLPVSVRRHMQKFYFRDWKARVFPAWPVDFTVDTLHEETLRLAMEAAGVKRMPFIWFWPDGAPNCLIMTHDVETSAGRDFTPQLMDLDESYGIKASFQVIPEKRYEISDEYIRNIRARGFEFNVHDLNHDGHLYRKQEEFLRRAKKINQYIRRYNASGFRAGAMYRNLDWYDAYEFSYDMSAPNVAHLEPKRGGCCTVFPFFVGKILELPLTTSQDYSLFHILDDYSIDLWREQLNLIRQRNGLMSFITHPDYLIDRRARAVYESLLDYLQQLIVRDKIWAALPGDVDQWWRARSEMKLAQNGNRWEIEGPQSHRARVAYATIDHSRLAYEFADSLDREGVRP
jgi:hypothetical protein